MNKNIGPIYISTGACAACSHCWAAAWELSDLDHSHAVASPLNSACHARFMCSTPALCVWRRLPLIRLKLSVGTVSQMSSQMSSAHAPQ